MSRFSRQTTLISKWNKIHVQKCVNPIITRQSIKRKKKKKKSPGTSRNESFHNYGKSKAKQCDEKTGLLNH